MKVLIQYTQTGKYKEQVWEVLTTRQKGDIQAVTPLFAAQLIGQKKACLITTDSGDVIFQA